MKREGYVSWDEYFMGVSLLAAERSKDPNTQVGACIVDENQRIVSTGYNGFPYGCSDDEFPWDRAGETAELRFNVPFAGTVCAVCGERSIDRISQIPVPGTIWR